MTVNGKSALRLDSIPPAVLSSITRLASPELEGDEVYKICQELILAIESSKDSAESIIPAYVVKRLVRGLGSTSDSTRIHFTCVLYALLKRFPDIFDLISALEKLLQKPSSGESRTEEVARLRGRLIAYTLLSRYAQENGLSLQQDQVHEMAEEAIRLWECERQLDRLAINLLKTLPLKISLGKYPKELNLKHRTMRLFEVLFCGIDSSNVLRDEAQAFPKIIEESTKDGDIRPVYHYVLFTIVAFLRNRALDHLQNCWQTIMDNFERVPKLWNPFVRGLIIDFVSNFGVEHDQIGFIFHSMSFKKLLNQHGGNSNFVHLSGVSQFSTNHFYIAISVRSAYKYVVSSRFASHMCAFREPAPQSCQFHNGLFIRRMSS